MKRRIYYLTAAAVLSGMVLITSCKKSFLENTPQGEFLESNFYANPAQASSGLVAAYDPLVTETGGLTNTYADKLGPLNSGSDECFAGGGSSSDIPDWQAFNNYTLSPATGPQNEFWPINFQGVNRADVLLQRLPGVPGLGADLLKRYTAEGH